MNLLQEYQPYMSMPLPLGHCLMTEKLLQFIWQFQYFNRSALQTTAGERLQVINPGQLNHNQGPDFTDAQVKIDDTMLVGSVEIHLKTSLWKVHGHHHDANYRNVVLHVVLENNTPGKSDIPVLELQSLIPNILLDKYEGLMNSTHFIPCASSIRQVNDLTWTSWKERLLAERLSRKSAVVYQFLDQNKEYWDEAFWWLLARHFGGPVNADAFESIARSLPLKMLGRHNNQIQQLEALLLGQAGLLNQTFKDSYAKLLQREFNFLKKKYSLTPVLTPVHFLRMRPGNFPTIRLAQLAAVLQHAGSLFSGIIQQENVREIRNAFQVTANDYWHYHYMLDEPSAFKKKCMGKDMIDHIVINTIIPMLFAYGLRQNDEPTRLKALRWLEETHAETNSITKGFMQLGVANKSAFDSQALTELKTKYCDHKRCLHCSVGNAILKLENNSLQL